MKKIFSILLIIVLILSFSITVGCQKNDNPNNPNNPNNPKIIIVKVSKEENWLATIINNRDCSKDEMEALCLKQGYASLEDAELKLEQKHALVFVEKFQFKDEHGNKVEMGGCYTMPGTTLYSYAREKGIIPNIEYEINVI